MVLAYLNLLLVLIWGVSEVVPLLADSLAGNELDP
jgi:Na+-transporting methylmalonyl-CoA/oxaloacetate decarboxylase gamma subunit